MANGTKNYFRHSFQARNDEKLVKLMELCGKEGYFYYFVVLEMCATQADSSFPDDNTFKFHLRSIASSFMSNTKGVLTILEHMTTCDLLVAYVEDNLVRLEIPNLSKYMGKYETKKLSNVPNKRKEKEIKEKKIKGNKIKEDEVEFVVVTDSPIFDHPLEINNSSLVDKLTEIQEGLSRKEKPNELVELFNSTSHIHQMPTVKVFSATRKKSLQKAVKEIGNDPETWKKVFANAGKKGFIGKDGREWRPDFDYIFRNSNYVKFSEEGTGGKIVPQTKTEAFLEQKRNNPYRT